MAKFDKNLKNEFFNEEELYDEDYGFDAEDDGYADDDQEFDALDESEVYEFPDEDGTELTEDAPEEEPAEDSGEQAEENETPEEGSSKARWYVVHTYSGYENKVAEDIKNIVANLGLEKEITDVRVPMEEVEEIKPKESVEDDFDEEFFGKKEQKKDKTKSRKLFPGYVLVKMIMSDENWYVIRNIRGCTGFVGPGSKPVPLTEEEIANMGVENKVVEVNFAIGDTVKIIDGSMVGFTGRVDEIDLENNKVRVVISMFGRETPAEFQLNQLELA